MNLFGRALGWLFPWEARAVSPVGRNQPCPCGSGLKYKRCCIDRYSAARRDETMAASVRKEHHRVFGPATAANDALESANKGYAVPKK